MNDQRNEIHWNIAGGLFYPELFNLAHLLRLMNQANPEMEVRMSVYDSHQGMIWNGGRVVQRCNSMTKEDAMLRVHQWNALGVGFYFVFSNHLLEEKHLQDSRCNYFLDNAHHPLNGVVCSSDILCSYIRRQFPLYTLKCSVMRPYMEGGDSWKRLEYYRFLLDLYDIVVLSPRINQDVALISQLPTDRLELLVNEACLSDCHYTRKHYQALNVANLSGNWDDIESTYFFCGRQHGKKLPDPPEMELSVNQVRDLHALGVKRFKLQGRTDSFHSGLRQSVQKFIVEPNLPSGVLLKF